MSDPQAVDLSLGVLDDRYMYICKVPRDTGFISRAGVAFLKHIKEDQSDTEKHPGAGCEKP